MTDLDDHVTAAKAGDHMAFGRLIESQAGWAYVTARAIVGSGTDAEDVVQEACLRAWRDLGSLRSPSMWIPWFRQILTRAAIDHTRSSRRIRDVQPIAAGYEPDPSAAVADRDQVLRWLRMLPAEERALLVLRFGHDLQLADVARLMGQPLGTTKSKLHRALTKLRDMTGKAPEHDRG